MIQPMFHKCVLRNVYEIICQCNERLMSSWKAAAIENKPINITKDTSYLALEIILRSLFSEDYDEMSYKGVNPFFILAEQTARDLDLVVKYHGLGKYIKECMRDRIEQNRYPDDFLSMLMLVEDKVTHQRMTEKEILDEVKTLIMAAHETTAATTNWIWYFLSKYEDVSATILNEIEQIEDDFPNFEELDKLSYTKQVIDEVLRLYPPVWLLSREVVTNTELGEYQLTSGTNVFISPYYIHRHRDYWSQPTDFYPYRFNAANMKNINRYTYIPFSMGQRRCIGEIFGIIEMKIHIAYVCRHLKLKYIDEKPIRLEALINLRTEDDFFMQVSVRH